MMKGKISATILIFAILFSAGCIDTQVEEKNGLESPPLDDAPEDEASFVDTKWELESFGPIGGETPVVPQTKVTLEIGLDGKIAGSAGCNNYFTAYESGEDNAISFGIIGSTMMYCEGTMEQEYRYLGAIENVTSFAMDRDGLQLFYNNGQGVLNFAAR